MFEEERQNNIKRCIQKRKEIINFTKKSKTKNHNIKNNKTEEKNSEAENYLNTSTDKAKKISERWNKNIITEKNKRILITEDSYIMQDSIGNSSLITKEDLKKVTCLKKEKSRLEKKAEEKDEYIMKLLKSEIF